MPSHAKSSFSSRNPPHVDIEMNNLNHQERYYSAKRCGKFPRVPTPLHPWA